MDETRTARYAELVSRRKACSACAGLVNPSMCQDGRFDSDQIGPWTQWQGNLDAELLIVGQDWGDTNYFIANGGHEARKNRTNETLRQLLSLAGFEVPPPSPSDSGGGSAFFTNAILCLKKGGLQAKVERSWFEQCGKLFLRPTIDQIGPSVVVTLGKQAYRATCEAYGKRPHSFRTAVASPGETLPNGSFLVPVYHCGARILNTHRPIDTQKHDWLRVRHALNASRSTR